MKNIVAFQMAVSRTEESGQGTGPWHTTLTHEDRMKHQSATDLLLADLLSADNGNERDDQLDDGFDRDGDELGDTSLTDYDPDAQESDTNDDADAWLSLREERDAA